MAIKKKKPSPAQLANRRRFAAASKAQAKAANSRKATGARAATANRARGSKRNAETRDSAHPIAVTRHYRGGPPGYMTAHQRAVASGQQPLFALNPRRRNPAEKIYRVSAKAPGYSKTDLGRVAAKSPADAIKKGKELATAKGLKLSTWGAVRDDGHDFRANGARRASTKARNGYARPAKRPASRSNSAKRRPAKKRNSAAAGAQLIHKEFLGRPSTHSTAIEASGAAPAHVAQLGKLVALRAKTEDFRFAESEKMLLCAGANGKLYIVGPITIEPGANFGELITVNYVARKSHIEAGKVIEYVHDFGEEGGQKPTLRTDSDGSFIIVGGSYRITPDGIAD